MIICSFTPVFFPLHFCIPNGEEKTQIKKQNGKIQYCFGHESRLALKYLVTENTKAMTTNTSKALKSKLSTMPVITSKMYAMNIPAAQVTMKVRTLPPNIFLQTTANISPITNAMNSIAFPPKKDCDLYS